MPSKSTVIHRGAVIDVGTNSVKLLVGDVAGAVVQPVLETGEQTRLGQGFYETHRLRAEAIQRTASAVAKFAEAARKLNAETLRVIATSAARDAENAVELLTAIKEASGLAVEVISGEQEADWAFQGVTSNPAFSQTPVLILDVGGGSTEFIVGQGQQQSFRNSYKIGAVRLLEQLNPSDPPTPTELARCRETLRQILQTEVAPQLTPVLQPFRTPPMLIGTGGTASILAKLQHQMAGYDRDIIESTHLSRESIQQRMEHLWRIPLAERRQLAGLPPERADVALTGIAIYEGVMNYFQFAELRASTRGLRFAALRTA